MKYYTVHEIAELTGLSVHTVRYYDDQRLIPGVTRGANGKRLFQQEQLDWVQLVCCLRNTGMSIADIRHYIELCEQGYDTVRERYEIILAQKKKALAEMREMQHRLEILSHKEQIYIDLMEKDAPDLLNPAVQARQKLKDTGS